MATVPVLTEARMRLGEVQTPPSPTPPTPVRVAAAVHTAAAARRALTASRHAALTGHPGTAETKQAAGPTLQTYPQASTGHLTTAAVTTARRILHRTLAALAKTAGSSAQQVRAAAATLSVLQPTNTIYDGDQIWATTTPALTSITVNGSALAPTPYGLFTFPAVAGTMTVVVAGNTVPIAVSPRTSVAVPASVDTTGATETSAALNTFLATLAPGSLVDFAGGTVWCEQTVGGTGLSSIKLANLTLVAKTPNPNNQSYSTRRHWLFTNCTDVVLDTVHVSGPNTYQNTSGEYAGYANYVSQYEGEAGFAFDGCTQVALRACTSTATYGDGCMVWGGLNSFLRVDHFTVSWNGRQGMSLVNAADVAYTNITIQNSRRSGIDLEPDVSGESVTDVWLDTVGCTSWLEPLPSHGDGDVSNIWATNWTIATAAVPVVDVSATDGTLRSNWNISGWTEPTGGLGSPQAALSFVNVQNITLTNNQLNVANRAGSLGTCYFGSCGGVATVTGNNFGAQTYMSVANPRAGFALHQSGNTPAQTVVHLQAAKTAVHQTPSTKQTYEPYITP